MCKKVVGAVRGMSMEKQRGDAENGSGVVHSEFGRG